MINLPSKKRLYPLVILLFASLVIAHKSCAGPYNDFDINNSDISPEEIHRGGPPRDGIPSIDNPDFSTPRLSNHLPATDRVLGLSHKGESKAYPISIMNWHEIVNDTIGDMPVVVTFCPLCGTGVAFSSHAGGKRLNFGVSGLLYNSDVLLYDRETESLWSQLLTRSISGPMKGTRLKLIPLEHTTWGDWIKRHPDTKVLSENTGYARDYDRDPYAGYENSQGTYFPVSHRDPRYHPKERVLGIEIKGIFKAYPFAELSKTNGLINDHINGTPVTIHYDKESHSARIQGAKGENLAGITAFWFAWIAFHPESLVFKAP
ncbi:DUF3179 domain-containing protein [Pseudomonadota bacterium]